MHIEPIVDVQGFRALRHEWNDLLEHSAADCLFLTWEWLHTWCEHLAADRECCLLTVRDRGDLVGLAPFALSPWRMTRFRMFRTLEFMGTGPVGSDYLDVIIRHGFEREVTDALAAYLARRGAVIDLAQVKGDSSFAATVAARIATHEWKRTTIRSDVCPYIELSGHSWESYLAGLRPKHRSNVQRCLRLLASRFDVSFKYVETDAERRAVIAELITLHHKRWGTRGGSTAFDSPALLAFHEDLSQLALDRGWLRLAVLRLTGAPVSAFYGFRYKQSFYYYQSGFDPDYGKYSVGLAALALTIKSAIAEGAEEYDFLHGDEPYKFHWAQSVRELHRLELFPPYVRGWLYRGAIETDRVVRKLARRVLSQMSV